MNEYAPGAEGEFVYDAGETGLVGTVEYRVDDNQGATVIAATTVDIIELGTTGVYSVTVTLPGTEGDWTIIWSSDGSFDPDTGASEQFRTIETPTEIPDTPPLVPISDDGVGSVGPCMAWTSAERVEQCCEIGGSDPEVLERSIVAASQLLYPLSGSQYSGTCERRVRPCGSTTCRQWGEWDGAGWSARALRDGCGCSPLSRVPLAGYVRSISEVTIDGEIVDADTYRLDERRWLTRVPHPSDLDTPLFWPACQDMSLDEGEEGTFSILYEYGVDPPVPGQMAAEELACAIFQTQCGGGGDLADCPLPTGVVRIEREGYTIDLDQFTGWGRDDQGIWRTGLPLVDAFLNAFNPTGKRKRSTVWSPDAPRFPRPVGTASS